MSEAVRLPDPASAFAARAARLRALAEGHSSEEWLRLLARIADGQVTAARAVGVPAARAPGDPPPLDYRRIPRDGSWHRMLSAVLSRVGGADLPVQANGALRELAASSEGRLEQLAGWHLHGATPPEALATAPFVGGALQAWFGALASGLGEWELRAAGGAACPACGAPPVAGVVDGTTRLRWLACSLCGASWNVPRLTCVSCGGDAELTYLHVEGAAGARAEACGGCGRYLKLFDQERLPEAEPSADDAATLALDLLVAAEGYEPIGASPWLAAGG